MELADRQHLLVARGKALQLIILGLSAAPIELATIDLTPSYRELDASIVAATSAEILDAAKPLSALAGLLRSIVTDIELALAENEFSEVRARLETALRVIGRPETG